jgi:hypothetical protein
MMPVTASFIYTTAIVSAGFESGGISTWSSASPLP